MSKRSILSDKAKNKIAEELNIQQNVKRDGWGDVSSKDCGNIVKKVIENVLNEKDKNN